MRAVDKGRPPLRATTRVIISVVDLPSTSASVPYFVSNFSTPVRLMENDRVGRMVCIVAATGADGHKLWYYITGELTFFLPYIQRLVALVHFSCSMLLIDVNFQQGCLMMKCTGSELL